MEFTHEILIGVGILGIFTLFFTVKLIRKLEAERMQLRKEREKRKQDREREVMWAEQARLGEILFEAVSKAAEENPNMHDKRTLRVWKYERNNGAFSVIVDLMDPGFAATARQFNIYPDRLSWYYGFNRDNDVGSHADFERMLETARETVRSFN